MQIKLVPAVLSTTFLLSFGLSQTVSANEHNDLILTKIMYDCPNPETAIASSEFVEIHNPTNQTISLNNYFISDSNSYYKLPETGTVATGDSDWIYQFPPDYSLAPGQTAVVVQSARRFVSSYLKTNTTADQAAEPSLTLADLDNFYNLPNSPLMFETTDSGNTASGASAPMPGVPKMIRRFESANHYTLNMTNDNEFVVLFKWDGTSNLVQDVDAASWSNPNAETVLGYGSSNSFPNKEGYTINTDTYKLDSGSTWNEGNLAFTWKSSSSQQCLTRMYNVTNEIQTGGNGITGQDVSTENVKATFEITSHGNARTTYKPGTVSFKTDTKLIYGNRTEKNPPANQDIFINTLITNPSNSHTGKIVVTIDYPIVSGTHEFPMPVASGSMSFANILTNIGSYPAGTYVKWHAELTDNVNSTVSRYPEAGDKIFVVGSTSADIVDKLVINELMYDPAGTDNTDNAEWIELYNNSASEIDLSYFRVGIHETNRGRFGLPEGTKIQANDYLILTSNKSLFETRYFSLGLDSSKIYQLQETAFTANTIPNSNTNMITITHINEYDRGNTDYPRVHIDHVAYEVGSNPTAEPPVVSDWPGILPTSSSSPYNTANPNNGGPSIELKNPTLDNAIGSNWAVSTAPIIWSNPPTDTTQPRGGTPLSVNSAYTSSIANWTIY